MRHIPARGAGHLTRLALLLTAFAVGASFPAPSAVAAENAMLDQIGPAAEPRAAEPAVPETPAAEPPLDARPNPVVPGGLTVDLQGRGERPFTATVAPDGTVRQRCGDAAGKE